MNPLNLPLAASDDDAYLASICAKNTWATAHSAQWLAAYALYRSHGGNPWHVSPATFVPDVSQEQYALYDKRKGTRRIRAIRDTPNLRCCPMCGSETTGSLDHFLPRDTFPEFSVMLANLVPACSHCNSGGKRQTYKGTGSESFIHPYFETIASVPIWEIEFVRPLQAVTFKAKPVQGLSASIAERVAFHLKNVLGKQFYLWAGTKWSNVPQLVRNAITAVGPITAIGVRNELLKQLGQANASSGLNSWLSAFFRGLHADPGAQAAIAQSANLLTATIPA